MEQGELYQGREALVVKANDLIQKSRFDLSLQQQKIILYLISQISPADREFKQYEFSIAQFCQVCGIENQNGKNHIDIKAAIKEISDKSLWVTMPDGTISLLRWIETADIIPRSGTIKVKLSEKMKPYLLELKSNFTQYELIYVLNFKSKYTIRFYELIKSIHYNELEKYKRTYTLDELRQLLGAENYRTYQHLMDRCLLRAIDEVNTYSDKTVTYKTIKCGRAVAGIEFTISTKDIQERTAIIAGINEAMGGHQLSIFDNE